jgi:nicotinate phosphoribosyltransferase
MATKSLDIVSVERTLKGGSKQGIDVSRFALPESHGPYTDKYFLRSGQVLRGENYNPFVKMQVFIRKGPGRVYGIEEAVAVLDRYSNIREKGRILALPEGSPYNRSEVVMQIEAPIQEIIELETMYLGVIAGETSRHTGLQLDFSGIKENARKVVEATDGKPVIYFGARHWKFDEDPMISHAAYLGGIKNCSTDIGAEAFGRSGVGTIPHVLVLMFGAKYGPERATIETAKAFDRQIEKAVPRIILVDTFNRELTDSRMVLEELGDRIAGFRLDTCGENIGEGGTAYNGKPYETGTGVTIELARNFYRQLEKLGFPEKQMVLSSGFADARKVAAFTVTEKRFGHKLYDSLGVGGLYPSIETKADIVEVDGQQISKAGRFFRPISRLEEVLIR